MNYLDELKSNEEIFLNYMKEKYPLYSKSNFFLRDLQYAITNFFKMKGKHIGFSESEKIALDFAAYLVELNVASHISNNTWRFNKVEEIVEKEVIEDNQKG